MKQSIELQMNQLKPVLKIEFNEQKDFFVIRLGQYSEIVSANFIRHQLGIEYKKKDGSIVTKHDIELSKQKSRKAYAKALSRELVTEEIPF